MNDLFAALRFLTRFPVPQRADGAGFGARAFPLVGLLLGAVALGVDCAARSLAPAIRNVLVLATFALLSGAIHYDGLADTLDALGGANREERLRIMRDGAIGTFAVLGLVLVVAAELAALGALSGGPRWRALLAAPMLGRFAMPLGGLGAPLARSEGLGAEFVRALTPADVAVSAAIASLSIVFLGGLRGAAAGLLVVAATFTVRRMAITRLGGVTGDVLGAVGKIAETITLLVFAP